jgi:hypothetical protein
MNIEVIRLYQFPIGDSKQTEGILYLRDESGVLIFECKTLELPWKDNRTGISCIEDGEYTAVKHTSPKLGASLWLQNVRGRTEILVHKVNYVRDLRGCIGVGDSLTDIDKDGLKDTTNSKKTMNKILSLLNSNTVKITIKWRT